MEEERKDQPTNAGLSLCFTALHVSCSAGPLHHDGPKSLKIWGKINRFPLVVPTIFITAVTTAHTGYREGRLLLWLPYPVVKSFCNGLWEDLKNNASAGLEYLNQSLVEDSGESSRHQNAGSNVDSEDCLCHFRKTLEKNWQANSCVTLRQRTYLYFCPCFEIVVALSLKIMNWWTRQRKCQGHTALSGCTGLASHLSPH